MEFLRGYFRSSIKLAEERGTEDQIIDMEGVIAGTSSSAGELSDLLTLKKSWKKNRHHPIPHLAASVVCGVKAIHEIRSEIKQNE